MLGKWRSHMKWMVDGVCAENIRWFAEVRNSLNVVKIAAFNFNHWIMGSSAVAE